MAGVIVRILRGMLALIGGRLGAAGVGTCLSRTPRVSPGRRRWPRIRILVSASVLMFFLVPIPGSAEVSVPDADSGTAPDLGLITVPRPDLSRVEDDVRRALEHARQELNAQLAHALGDRRSAAEAFGNTGLLYQAHLMLAEAAACYRNAALLDPENYRWPYYLGYLEQQASGTC